MCSCRLQFGSIHWRVSISIYSTDANIGMNFPPHPHVFRPFIHPLNSRLKVRRVYWPSLVFNRQGQVKHVYWVIKGPLKWRFYDYWKIQRNETIEQICAGLEYLYDHDLSHNNLDLRTIFMIQSDTGDRPVIGGFDRLSKMSLAIDASCLARIIISGELLKIHS